MSKLNISSVVFLLSAVFVVNGARQLKQGGISDAIAQAQADADDSVFIRDSGKGDSKQLSQAAATSIFETLSKSELQAAARAAVEIVRRNKQNKPTVQIAGQGVTQVAGVSDSNSGVRSLGGTVIRAQATPTAGALEMESNVIVQSAGKGEVAAVNEQEGGVATKDGQATFQTFGEVSDSGKNSEAVIVADGYAIVTEDYAKSSSTVCASAGGADDCD